MFKCVRECEPAGSSVTIKQFSYSYKRLFFSSSSEKRRRNLNCEGKSLKCNLDRERRLSGRNRDERTHTKKKFIKKN